MKTEMKMERKLSWGQKIIKKNKKCKKNFAILQVFLKQENLKSLIVLKY